MDNDTYRSIKLLVEGLRHDYVNVNMYYVPTKQNHVEGGIATITHVYYGEETIYFDLHRLPWLITKCRWVKFVFMLVGQFFIYMIFMLKPDFCLAQVDMELFFKNVVK